MFNVVGGLSSALAYWRGVAVFLQQLFCHPEQTYTDKLTISATIYLKYYIIYSNTVHVYPKLRKIYVIIR